MEVIEHRQFLPDSLASDLYDYGFSVATGNAVQNPQKIWTNLKWHDSLVANSGLVLCIRPPKEIKNQIENNLIEKNFLDLEKEKRISQTGINVNVWGRGSYITAHPDLSYSKSITIYLNKNWNYNDGGIFHWQNSNNKEWNSVAPTFNKAVINQSGVMHGISPVQSNFRITLQIFIHKK